MKNKKHKKAMAGFLIIVLLVADFMQLIMKIDVVNAEEVEIVASTNSLPEYTQFATKKELMREYDTQISGSNIHGQKVWFGKNNQQWYIAGTESNRKEDNLTLFSMIPLLEDTKFQNNTNEQEFEGMSVLCNHYGASVLRKKLQKLEKSRFTKKELELMNVSNIEMYDWENGESYTIKERLYVPEENEYMDGYSINVGIESVVLVEPEFWGNYDFWMRSTASRVEPTVYVASQGELDMISEMPNTKHDVMCAFNLDISSLLFASNVPANASEGELKEEELFTFRYESKDIGSVEIQEDKNEMVIKGAESGARLVIQTQEKAYGLIVSDDMTINTDTIGNSLTDFENCRIWLEVFDEDEGITKAVMAKEKGENVDLDKISEFATKSQLMQYFSTYDGDENKIQGKLMQFGNGQQNWYIVGKDKNVPGENIVLFAASPLEQVKYQDDGKNDQKFENEMVYSNHYGASDLRIVLGELTENCFLAEEQKLLIPTTFYTDDTKNNKIYELNEILYPAYGKWEDKYITVGVNSPEKLNGGLRIDKSYCGTADVWLRTPDEIMGQSVVRAGETQHVMNFNVEYEFDVVPAFNLDISTVNFASTVHSASGDGAGYSGNVFYLRHIYPGDEETELGIVEIDKDYKYLEIKAAGDDVYLMVQAKNGAYCKKVHANEIINVEEIDLGSGEKISTFSDCKIWLEKKDKEKQMIYAVMAKKQKVVYTISVGLDNVVINDIDEQNKKLPKSVILSSEGMIENLEEILVDGKLVDASNYIIDTVGNCVKLKREYLETLSKEAHSVDLIYTDGFGDSIFDIVYAKTTTDNKTKDSSMGKIIIVVIGVILLAGGGGFAGYMMWRRKRKG